MSNIRRKLLLTVAVLVLAATMMLGISYARYQMQISGTVSLQAANHEQVTLLTDGWVTVDGEDVLNFSIAESEQICRVYVMASEGISAPEDLQITLTLLGEEPQIFSATAKIIHSQSIFGTFFGEGYVYEFLDSSSGNELSFELTSDQLYRLTVTQTEGAASQPAMLRLFVEQTQN